MGTYRPDPIDQEGVAWTVMHEPWFERLNELEKRWVPNSKGNESAYESQLRESMVYIYMGCNQAAAGKYDEEVCDKAFDFVLSDMKNFDPALQSLGKYVSFHIHSRLKDAYRIIKGNALSDPKPVVISADDDTNGPSTITDPNGSPDEEFEETDAAQTVIGALVLNFIAMKNQKKREHTLRHYQMFYTEQLTCSAQIVPLPEKWQKDILNALHHPYFRYFIGNVADTDAITLHTIEHAIPKMLGEVIPGKSMDALLAWDDEFFLPAKVQICYLEQKEQIQVSPAAITARKNEYRESLRTIRRT